MMKTLIILAVLLGMGLSRSYGEEIITFGPKDTKIVGTIAYAVIGQYRAQFSAFKGRIIFDEESHRIQSVYLEIQANSIKSNSPWCDKIVRSRRLLFTSRYPKIIFKSDKIILDESGPKVQGVLEMKRIKRRFIFPFKMGIMMDQKTKGKWLDLKGHWTINRRYFNIVWNRYLDRGGVLVGNYFTVTWWAHVHLNSM